MERLLAHCTTAMESWFVTQFGRWPVEWEQEHLLRPDASTWLEEYKQTEVFARLQVFYGHDYHNASAPFGLGHWLWKERWQQSAENTLAAIRELGGDVRTCLEVGTGRGSVVMELRDLGVDAWGTDISEWCAANPLPEVDGFISAASVCSIPLADRGVDLVVAFDVLEHVPADFLDMAIDEVTRVAKEWVVVTVPNPAPGEEVMLTSVGPEVNHYIGQPPEVWASWFRRRGFGQTAVPMNPEEFPLKIGDANYVMMFRRG